MHEQANLEPLGALNTLPSTERLNWSTHQKVCSPNFELMQSVDSPFCRSIPFFSRSSGNSPLTRSLDQNIIFLADVIFIKFYIFRSL